MIHLAQICFCNTVFDGVYTKKQNFLIAVHAQWCNTNSRLYTPGNRHWNMHCTFKSHLWVDQMCTSCITASLSSFFPSFYGSHGKVWSEIESITNVGEISSGACNVWYGCCWETVLEGHWNFRTYLGNSFLNFLLFLFQLFGPLDSISFFFPTRLPFLLLLPLILLLCTFAFSLFHLTDMNFQIWWRVVWFPQDRGMHVFHVPYTSIQVHQVIPNLCLQWEGLCSSKFHLEIKGLERYGEISQTMGAETKNSLNTSAFSGWLLNSRLLI